MALTPTLLPMYTSAPPTPSLNQEAPPAYSRHSNSPQGEPRLPPYSRHATPPQDEQRLAEEGLNTQPLAAPSANPITRPPQAHGRSHNFWNVDTNEDVLAYGQFQESTENRTTTTNTNTRGTRVRVREIRAVRVERRANAVRSNRIGCCRPRVVHVGAVIGLTVMFVLIWFYTSRRKHAPKREG